MGTENSNDIARTVSSNASEQQPHETTMTTATMKGREFHTFKSNIQEDLSLNEIIFHLQSRRTSSLSEKRKMLSDIVKERDAINAVFEAVSKKLGSSFLSCLPRKSETADKSKSIKSYEDVIVRATFKLAVLFDVYKTALGRAGHAPDMNTEQLFQPVVAVVVRAKRLARQQRNNDKINSRVNSIIEEIMKTSFAESGLGAGTGTWACGDGRFVGIQTESQRRALSRYRALLGLGARAISKTQLHRLVSDLVRSDQLMHSGLVAAALDDVLGIIGGSTSLRNCPPRGCYPSY